eukprot:989402_1
MKPSKMFKNIVCQAIMVTALGGSIVGYTLGAIASLNASLQNHYNTIDPLLPTLNAGVLVVGALLGCIAAGFLADAYGRKPILMWSTIFCCIVPTIYLAVVDHVQSMLGVRVILGMSIGIYCAVCPMYMAECSPTAKRGQLGTIFQLSICSAMFIGGGVMGFYVEDYHWRMHYAFTLVFALPMAALTFSMRESPRWLYVNGRDIEARADLATIVGESEVEKEINSIKQKSTAQPASWSVIFSRKYALHLGIGLTLAATQQLTGINAMLIFSRPIILNTAPATDMYTLNMVSAMVFAWNALTTLLTIRFVDIYGRRFFLLSGMSIMTFALVGTTVGLALFEGLMSLTITMGSILLFILGFEIGIGPAFFPLVSEIFPDNIRGRISSIIITVTRCLSGVIAFTFLYMQQALGKYVMIPFTVMSAACTLIIYLILPETKGKTLGQIQDLLSQKKPFPVCLKTIKDTDDMKCSY